MKPQANKIYFVSFVKINEHDTFCRRVTKFNSSDARNKERERERKRERERERLCVRERDSVKQINLKKMMHIIMQRLPFIGLFTSLQFIFTLG